MKKFNFSLARVEDWRGMLARIEESKLEQMYAELHGIAAREASLLKEREESGRAVLADPSKTGADLAALDAFQKYSDAQYKHLQNHRSDCLKRIAAQTQLVVSKRRDVKLLAQLREKQFQAWTLELNRELDAQADEAHLAKWKRAASGSD